MRQLTVLVAEKSKIKVAADPVLGEGPFPGLQVTTFLLCPYLMEREGALVPPSPPKGAIPIVGVPPLKTRAKRIEKEINRPTLPTLAPSKLRDEL